jgi:sporulation protein YlmC with PRC-barrel domain
MVSSEFLIGKEMIDTNGVLLGVIVSLELRLEDWKVTHVNLELDVDISERLGLRTGLLGLDRRIVSVPVDSINNVGDVVTIKTSIRSLDDLTQAHMKVLA